MTRRSPLDDPEKAAFAWGRFRRLMKAMGWVTGGVIVIVLAGLYWSFGLVSVHLYIASALGIGFTMMLGAALMGLAFLSSGTGHDESIEGPFEDE